MILTDLIKEQLFHCAVMAGAGSAVMILYQLFKGTCGLFTMKPAAAAASIVAFWALAGVITYKFLYYCAYGEVSFHSAGAFTAGALLWKKFFYDIIDKIYSWIYMKQGKHNKNGEKEKKQPIQREQSSNRH